MLFTRSWNYYNHQNEQMINLHLARSYFHNVLPNERLGQQHYSFDEFRRQVDREQHVMPDVTPLSTKSTIGCATCKSKEYTLIIVTEYGTKRILLGKKHRGFGKGMTLPLVGKLNLRNEILYLRVPYVNYMRKLV